ncbi:MAG: response regulator [Meiothermus sp.]|uniref:response regulator n=1 Tax=Meiothermus sp. TaxID=1955249 RepID=UPI0025EC9277|nr:response regulator [Meiothermus sp.]MCS7059027.1 response regulator [Meiothermus sp.]MCS7194170.1 response regulator [Meiothermus sp.]MCX7740634.1 response regulator [Meiothermus sp.]MDW8090031.1 response regulator [Meiothermus sp.]MDW8480680.1 response regulator [Meiothermus sp.]
MSSAPQTEKILVVTSSPALRALLELCLEEQGFQGEFYERAQQALEFLKAQTPRAIVLDDAIEIDPFSIASRLKMSRRLREVPVVLLLSDSDERAKLTAEFVRVEHVLSKPLDRKALSNILRGLPQRQPSL